MINPYIPFYPRDWLAEYRLRMLSPADRGIWIDLLCLMAMAEPYGHLANMGKPIGDAEICRILGIDEPTYKGSLKRLCDAGVCDVGEDGIVMSRRLIRDNERRVTGARFGKKGGGSPLLSKNKKKNNPIQSNPLKLYRGGIKVANTDFDQFWQAYPRKQGRKKALSSWQSSTMKPEVQIILNSLELQKKSEQWRKDGGQYIPMPTTWINQERWNDQLHIDVQKPVVKIDKKQQYERAFQDILKRLKEYKATALNPSDYQDGIRALSDAYKDYPGALKEALEIVG